MSLDTDVSSHDMRAGVYLRVERFDLITRILGCKSDIAIGRLIGMTDKTVGRAREGVIGERFIAAVLTAFARHEQTLSDLGIAATFEEVFEIGEKKVAA